MSTYRNTGDNCILCYNYNTLLNSSQLQHLTSENQSQQFEEISQDLIYSCTKHLPSEIVKTVNWQRSSPRDFCAECQGHTKKLSHLNSQLELVLKEINELVSLITRQINKNRQNYWEQSVPVTSAINPDNVLNVPIDTDDGIDHLGSPENIDGYEEEVPVTQNLTHKLSITETSTEIGPNTINIKNAGNGKLSSKRSEIKSQPPVRKEVVHPLEKEANTVKSSDLLPHLDNPDGFECSSCHKTFSRLAILQRHDCQKPTHDCTTCGKSFSTAFVLKLHNRCHSGEQPFKCETCGKGFSIKHNLIRHIRIHTGEKPFTCEVCKKSFSDETGYVRHSRIHKDDTDTSKVKYKCDICSKQLSELKALKKHLLKHTRYKKCEVCERSFRTAERLEKHKLTHRQETFECSICEKKLSTASSLKDHLSMHRGEKSYQCPICEKKLRRKSDLKNHMYMHETSKEETFICERCGKCFHVQFKYKRHLRTHTDKFFPCEVCKDKQFTTKQQLDVHKIVAHTTEKPFVCEICGKAFKTNDRLSRHKKMHSPKKSLTCDLCHRICHSSQALTAHKRKYCQGANKSKLKDGSKQNSKIKKKGTKTKVDRMSDEESNCSFVSGSESNDEKWEEGIESSSDIKDVHFLSCDLCQSGSYNSKLALESHKRRCKGISKKAESAKTVKENTKAGKYSPPPRRSDRFSATTSKKKVLYKHSSTDDETDSDGDGNSNDSDHEDVKQNYNDDVNVKVETGIEQDDGIVESNFCNDYGSVKVENENT